MTDTSKPRTRPVRPERTPPTRPSELPHLEGRIAWFREPPLLRSVVRVVRVTKQARMVCLELEVLASAVLQPTCVWPPGERLQVSASLVDDYAVWWLHGLAAADVHGAMDEVQAWNPRRPIRWLAPSPSGDAPA